jgi:hypothetical protein
MLKCYSVVGLKYREVRRRILKLSIKPEVGFTTKDVFTSLEMSSGRSKKPTFRI